MTRQMFVTAALLVLLVACSSGITENSATTTTSHGAATTTSHYVAAPPPTRAAVPVPTECETALGHHDNLAADLAAALNHYIAGIDAGQYGALEGRYSTAMRRFRQTEAQWADVIEDCPLDHRTSATRRWNAASQRISELRAVCRSGPGPDLGWSC